MPPSKESIAQPESREQRASEPVVQNVQREGADSMRLRLRTLLTVPIASIIALAIHLGVSWNAAAAHVESYALFLGSLLAAALLSALGQWFSIPLRRWIGRMFPIVAAAILLLCVWELITTGFHWLPLPYFPGPAAVLQSMVSDYQLLFD